jgi:HEAT repeat protein
MDLDPLPMRKAIDHVAKMGEKAVNSLISILTEEEDQDPYSKLYCHPEGDEFALIVQLTLAKIGRPAVEPLIEAFNDKSRPGRRYIPYIFGEIRDRSTLDPLIAASKDDLWIIRKEAAYPLSHFADKRAKEALRQMAENDPSSVCQTLAKQILEKQAKKADSKKVSPAPKTKKKK